MAYTITKDNKVHALPDNIARTVDVLEKGFYEFTCIKTPMGDVEILEKKELNIPKSAKAYAEKVINIPELKQYFSKKSVELHKALGIRHKTGYLFEGIQGSGKTTTIQAMCEILIDLIDARVFVVSGYYSYAKVHKIIERMRAADKTSWTAILLWDECERDMRDYEIEIKGYLDGINSLTNCLTLCSTNYIDRIPDTIKKRKGRFKDVISLNEIEHQDIVNMLLEGFNEASGGLIGNADMYQMGEKGLNKTIDDIKQIYVNRCMQVFDVEDRKAAEKEAEKLLDTVKVE